MKSFRPTPPRSPFTTAFSRTARETGIRILNLFEWKRRRPPTFLLLLICGAVLLCGSLVSCRPKEATHSLTQEELDYFNQEFFNGSTGNMHNQFLTSEYTSPGEINLFELFYNGIDGTAAQLSRTEREKLSELEPMTEYSGVIKVTRQEMDQVLEGGLGMGLTETQQQGLERFYDLEQPDTYYLVHGDTNFQWCTITSGTHISDQQVQLQYNKDDGTAWEVTMESRGDSYVFCSNVKR